MNKFLQSTIGISAAGLLVLLAANGAALIAAAGGAWTFLLTLAHTAPLGLSSFVLALALGVAAQPFLRKWLPDLGGHAPREFVVETVALAIGIGVMYAQLRSLSGLLLGILAGFMAPYAQKGLAALGTLLHRAYVSQADEVSK